MDAVQSDERRHEKDKQLIDRAVNAGAVTVAVAHPCDPVSLQGAVEAARIKLIHPILVGPKVRIRDLAVSEGLDISGFPIVDAEHSHVSADKAVAVVRKGDAEALMKGSRTPTN